MDVAEAQDLLARHLKKGLLIMHSIDSTRTEFAEGNLGARLVMADSEYNKWVDDVSHAICELADFYEDIHKLEEEWIQLPPSPVRDRRDLDIIPGRIRHQMDSAITKRRAWLEEKRDMLRPPSFTLVQDFVNPEIIDALKALKNTTFDLRQLIEYCEELNLSKRAGCTFACLFLSRAILDHVPPIFGVTSFEEVANNAKGLSSSKKRAMKYLNDFHKQVANDCIHKQVSGSLTLPSPDHAYCEAQMDLLLREVLHRLE